MPNVTGKEFLITVLVAVTKDLTEAQNDNKDAVDDEGNPEYQGIDQSKLVPLLTAALQEAVAKIEVLEQRLNDAGL